MDTEVSLKVLAFILLPVALAIISRKLSSLSLYSTLNAPTARLWQQQTFLKQLYLLTLYQITLISLYLSNPTLYQSLNYPFRQLPISPSSLNIPPKSPFNLQPAPLLSISFS